MYVNCAKSMDGSMSFVILAMTLYVATVRSQMRTPAGMSPTRILARRTLSDGTKEVTVASADLAIYEGRRVAFVDEYQCVKTVHSGSRVRQERTTCLPKVNILYPPPPSTTTTTTTTTTPVPTTRRPQPIYITQGPNPIIIVPAAPTTG